TSSFASHIICTFFFFSHTAPTASYTLSLHDARPIYEDPRRARDIARPPFEEYFRALNEAVGDWERGTSKDYRDYDKSMRRLRSRSEEHTSELQSQAKLVCRLLLEKKKKETHNPLLHR